MKRKIAKINLRPFPILSLDLEFGQSIVSDDSTASIFNTSKCSKKKKKKNEKEKTFMGKKKKKLKGSAKANIQILKSGKLKISGGQKMDLNPFIEKSVENTVVSRLDAIISQEVVEVEDKNTRVAVRCNLINEIHTAELNYRTNGAEIPTIIVPINKKDSLDVFDYLDSGVLGSILRLSTFAAVYSKIKEDWVELNKKDSTGFTNVLYVPDVLVILDKHGKFRETPVKINVCVVAIPSPNKMNVSTDSTDIVEKPTDEEVVARIVADLVESSIKCGGDRIIVNPFGTKQLLKDVTMTADIWNQILSSERCISQIKSIDFSIEDEDLYVVFNARRQ